MILPDVNVLLHAVNTGAPQHATASQALKDAYQKGPVALCWPALLGFLRLGTRAGILPRPLTVEQGLDVMRAWLEQPASVLVQPTPQHAPCWAVCCWAQAVADRWCQTPTWPLWPLNTAPRC